MCVYIIDITYAYYKHTHQRTRSAAEGGRHETIIEVILDQAVEAVSAPGSSQNSQKLVCLLNKVTMLWTYEK